MTLSISSSCVVTSLSSISEVDSGILSASVPFEKSWTIQSKLNKKAVNHSMPFEFEKYLEYKKDDEGFETNTLESRVDVSLPLPDKEQYTEDSEDEENERARIFCEWAHSNPSFFDLEALKKAVNAKKPHRFHVFDTDDEGENDLEKENTDCLTRGRSIRDARQQYQEQALPFYDGGCIFFFDEELEEINAFTEEYEGRMAMLRKLRHPIACAPSDPYLSLPKC